MRAELDATDLTLLDVLQHDCSLSAAELAEKVGLSQSPCWRRVQRLKDEGYIKRKVAVLDRRRLGLNAHVFARVKLSAHGRAHLAEFSKAVQSFPEVLECYVMMGETDFLLRIVTEDVDAYERFFFERLSRLPGVQEINSTVALSEIKASTALPLLGSRIAAPVKRGRRQHRPARQP
ncbi:MAG: Lrp/AsnC family transcriptional regulator [Rhizomicrobium sp.]